MDRQHFAGLDGDLHETLVAPANSQLGSYHAVACPHFVAVVHGRQHADKRVPSAAPDDPDLATEVSSMKLASQDPIVIARAGLAFLALPRWRTHMGGETPP
jgi:hypothetical protein